MADDAERAQVRLYFYQEDQVRVLNALATRDRANLIRMMLASAMRSGELRSMLDQLGYESDKLLAGTSVPLRTVYPSTPASHAANAAAPAIEAATPVAIAAPSPVRAPERASSPSTAPNASAAPIEVSAPAAAPAEPPLKQKVPPKISLGGFFGETPRTIRKNQ